MFHYQTIKQMSNRQSVKQLKRWVIKVGSALLTNDGLSLHTPYIRQLAAQIACLNERDIEVVLVSSGSVAAGMGSLNMSSRPKAINELQAAAAVGQANLMQCYQAVFEPHRINIAQVLLSHADIADRERYLNARSTLTTLLELDVLSVVNENDTVATDEMCLGDNDRLAALVVGLVDADLLVILTDQNGLYTADPRKDPTAELVGEASADDSKLLLLASGGSSLGRGGMVTKIQAAQQASRSGVCTVIANGNHDQILIELSEGVEHGTWLQAQQRLTSKKQWMAGLTQIKGSLTIDTGAVQKLKNSGSSLLPVGVVDVSGDFNRGELISCLDNTGKEIARGLSNYAAPEVEKISGRASTQISEILGYPGDDELIHRDNMVVF